MDCVTSKKNKEENDVCPHCNRPCASLKHVASVDDVFGLDVCCSLLEFDLLSELGNIDNICFEFQSGSDYALLSLKLQGRMNH